MAEAVSVVASRTRTWRIQIDKLQGFIESFIDRAIEIQRMPAVRAEKRKRPRCRDSIRGRDHSYCPGRAFHHILFFLNSDIRHVVGQARKKVAHSRN